ncbi:hypothetical protein ACFWOJ_08260 [Streptomyces sp. NPDC058439]|uniref:hypothetical protein n=1 Tax=Streptomyces sp. NPDC058439 TaxID=3346500 RepID=UPI00365E9777
MIERWEFRSFKRNALTFDQSESRIPAMPTRPVPDCSYGGIVRHRVTAATLAALTAAAGLTATGQSAAQAAAPAGRVLHVDCAADPADATGSTQHKDESTVSTSTNVLIFSHKPTVVR